MNFEKIGQNLSVLANIGVVFGIILLLIELQQTQDSMAAQMSIERTNRSNEIMASVFDRNLMQLGEKLGSDIEPSDTELNEVYRYVVLAMRHHEDIFYQRQLGLIDDELWVATQVGLSQTVNAPGFRIAYPNWPDPGGAPIIPANYRASFVNHINSLLE